MADLLQIPIVGDYCIEAVAAPGELCITFPGGGQLCAHLGFDSGDLTGITQSLIADLNAALMPLVPIFNVMDVVKLIFDAIKAVPGMIGPPPQPQKLLQLIPQIQKVVDKLLALFPPMSVPVLIKSILNVIITALLGLRNDIVAMISAQQRCIAAATKAAQLGNITFSAAADCAQQNLNVLMQNKNASLGPLNRLIGLVNFFMDLIGLGCIPLVPGFDSLTNAALAPLDALIKVLEAIRDAINLGSGGGALPSPCS